MGIARIGLLVLIASLTSMCLAQSDPMGLTAKMTATSTILNFPDIRKELKLDGGQNKKLDALLKDFNNKQAELGRTIQRSGTNMSAMMAAYKEFDAVTTEADAALEAELTPEQKQRLQQLRWQAIGAKCLYDPAMQAIVGLTSEQIGKLVEYQSGETQRFMENAKGGGTGSVKRMKGQKKKDADFLLGVLDDEQKAKYKAALGPLSKAAERLSNSIL